MVSVNNPSESHMTPVHMTKQTENKLTRLFLPRQNERSRKFIPSVRVVFSLTDQREYEKCSMFTGTRSAALHHTGVPTARALRITRVTAPLLDDVIAAHFNPVRTSSCVFMYISFTYAALLTNIKRTFVIKSAAQTIFTSSFRAHFRSPPADSAVRRINRHKNRTNVCTKLRGCLINAFSIQIIV